MLNIDETTLDHLDNDWQSKSEEKNYQMLLLWSRANGSQATFKILGQAFVSVKRKDLQEKLYELCGNLDA